MAEVLLRARAPEGSDVAITSAGIAALVEEPANPDAVRLMQEHDLDISAHRARQLTAEMVFASDLILVMERGHQQHICSLAPAARGRVHLLGKWLDREIPDPYKKSSEYFEYVLGLIEQNIEAWSKKLWG